MDDDAPTPPASRRRSRRRALPRAEWIVAAALPLLLLAILVVHMLLARAALREQLDRHNQAAAAALAIALAQQSEAGASPRPLAAAQFELGHYAELLLLDADDRRLVDLRQDGAASRAPAWFGRLLPIDAAPGVAAVSLGPQHNGRLLVALHEHPARDALWVSSLDLLLLLLLLGAACAALAVGWLRLRRRAMRSALDQAHALAHGRTMTVTEPRQPELRQLARSLNEAARRQRKAAVVQAEQVAQLQRQAQLDVLTGLLLRQPFVLRLQDLLRRGDAARIGLVLVRVVQLEALNERLGHEATDRALRHVADVLLTYVERVSGALAGRLNGSDFGLVLPVAGVAAETAAQIHETLGTAPALRGAGVEIVVGAADGLGDLAAGAALAEADAALARAEAGEGVVTDGSAGLAAGPAGAGAWRRQIADALAAGRLRLDEQPCVDAVGRLLHLACAPQLALDEGGAFQPASSWLALARRSRLTPQIDLGALELALQAVAADGRPRALRLSPDSVAVPGTTAELARRLQAAPEAARRLALEWIVPRKPGDARALADAAASLRPLGVRLGVAQIGGEPRGLPRLREIGVDHVVVDARFVQGVSRQEAVRAYALSLLALIHGLGLQALAEGVADAADLQALRALGYDGAAGAAVVAVAAVPAAP